MIWHCRTCATWNANINQQCIVCNSIGTIDNINSDNESYDIYLETIFWYMKAEVENRLNNTLVMSINGFAVTTK